MFSSGALIPVKEYSLHYRDVEKFIEFCKECHNYGTCWACPPYDFDTTEVISKYKNAYIIGTKIIPKDTSSKDTEWVKQISHKLLAHARIILDEKLLVLEKAYPDSRAFYAGTCFACSNGSCTRIKRMSCINPDRVRPSLEAFGFDIEKTSADLLHIELKWSSDGLFPEYYTLVSGFFTNHTVSLDNVEAAIGKEYKRKMS